MRTQLLIGIASLMVCGVASAQAELPTIEVRAGTLESVQVSCAKPDTVSAKDVERVLSITDPTTTPMLRRRLIHAASAACNERRGVRNARPLRRQAVSSRRNAPRP